MNKIIIVLLYLLSLFLISCHSTQTLRNDKFAENPIVSFVVNSLSPSSVDSLEIADGSFTKMTNSQGQWRDLHNPSPPVTCWKVYLPYSDTIKLEVGYGKNEVVGQVSKKFLNRGLYFVKLDTFMNMKSSVYNLKVSVCDTIFLRKFLIYR